MFALICCCFPSNPDMTFPLPLKIKFEGSNYNGKQLYEQSETELGPEEAKMRRTKLQELEVKFEDSVKALKSAEDSRQTGLNQPLRHAMGLMPHRQLLPGAAGLAGPGILNTESAWLRGTHGPGRHLPPMGLGGVGGLPSLAGPFDPALWQGYMDPMTSTGLNAGGLREMNRLSDYGRIPNATTGEAKLDHQGLGMAGLSGGAAAAVFGGAPVSGLGSGASFLTLPVMSSAGLGFPSSASANPAGMLAAQEMILQQQLSQRMQQHQQLQQDSSTRRRLMDLLSQQPATGPEAEIQAKRPSMAEGGNADDSKRRRMY